jgi:hypothetical protein
MPDLRELFWYFHRPSSSDDVPRFTWDKSRLFDEWEIGGGIPGGSSIFYISGESGFVEVLVPPTAFRCVAMSRIMLP